jgi:hypothetical protein
VRRFRLMPEHVTLLRAANVRWEVGETGAPAIDSKRPYGNSDVELDVARLLGWELVETRGGEELTRQQDANARAVHRETETGEYVAESDYGRDWQRAPDG